MPSNFDLALYGGLTLLVFGVPAAIYKYVFAGDGAAGLSNVVTVERDAVRAKVGSTPNARYNTEQLRQTVARLRAQDGFGVKVPANEEAHSGARDEANGSDPGPATILWHVGGPSPRGGSRLHPYI
eukprot:1575171-Pyramimonas_sp.AAC.1